MPKKLITRIFPGYHKVREHPSLRLFGTLLHDPNLFHLNRRSVAGGVAVGFFLAFVPFPFQMITAAALAILLRVNLPIAVSGVWLTNPITMAPMFYLAYKLGQWVLDTPPVPFDIELTWEWLRTDMLRIWQPFLLGCLLFSMTASVVGYVGMRVFWRVYVVRKLERRRARRVGLGPQAIPGRSREP
jgi:uncharacterized protein (DUF2062 family)